MVYNHFTLGKEMFKEMIKKSKINTTCIYISDHTVHIEKVKLQFMCISFLSKTTDTTCLKMSFTPLEDSMKI